MTRIRVLALSVAAAFPVCLGRAPAQPTSFQHEVGRGDAAFVGEYGFRHSPSFSVIMRKGTDVSGNRGVEKGNMGLNAYEGIMVKAPYEVQKSRIGWLGLRPEFRKCELSLATKLRRLILEDCLSNLQVHGRRPFGQLLPDKLGIGGPATSHNDHAAKLIQRKYVNSPIPAVVPKDVINSDGLFVGMENQFSPLSSEKSLPVLFKSRPREVGGLSTGIRHYDGSVGRLLSIRFRPLSKDRLPQTDAPFQQVSYGRNAGQDYQRTVVRRFGFLVSGFCAVFCVGFAGVEQLTRKRRYIGGAILTIALLCAVTGLFLWTWLALLDWTLLGF